MKVTYIDHMGSDLLATQAARGCYGKGAEEANPRLIQHLAESRHWTPFSHPHVCLRIEAPIFVWRQVTRSRRGLDEGDLVDDTVPIDITSITEQSRRYDKGPPVFYRPQEWRLRGGGVATGRQHDAIDVQYTTLINAVLLWMNFAEEAGVTHELARIGMPVALYTSWYWTGSLAAWARVAQLRLDTHAQKEAQDLAQMVSDVIQPLFPISWKELVK